MASHVQGISRAVDTISTVSTTANAGAFSLHEASSMLHAPMPISPPAHIGPLLAHPMPLNGQESHLILSSPVDPFTPYSTLTFSSLSPGVTLVKVVSGKISMTILTIVVLVATAIPLLFRIPVQGKQLPPSNTSSLPVRTGTTPAVVLQGVGTIPSPSPTLIPSPTFQPASTPQSIPTPVSHTSPTSANTPVPTPVLIPTSTPAQIPTQIPPQRSVHLVSSPNPGTQINYLNGISASSSTDIWSVGYSESTPNVGKTMIEHWNGTQWSVVSSPSPGISSGLGSIAALSPDNVWAVGGYNTTGAYQDDQTLVEHWDGTQWTIVPTPGVGTSYNTFLSVTALSANDVWAVGLSSNSYPQQEHTLTEHWNGTQWNIVPSPDLTVNDHLEGVFALSSNDVWAVGAGNTNASIYTDQNLVEHWDGHVWTIIPAPNQGSSINDVGAITGNSANDLWAVGSYSNSDQPHSQSTIMHWDGTNWTIVAHPHINSGGTILYSIASHTANDVCAAGENFVDQSAQTILLCWNGTSWNFITSINPDSSNAFFAIVSIVNTGQFWMVGGYGPSNTSSNYSTLTEVY